jgi:ATP/maltotriose-dependent transcriptional regulator MalT
MTDIAPPELGCRDREILTLLTWGYTNQQVADALDVSITTAKTYIRLAYLEIGVTHRTEAVVWGVRHDLFGAAMTALILAPVPRS